MSIHMVFLASTALLSVQAMPVSNGSRPGRLPSVPVLAWADFDRDGRQDVFLAQPSGQDHLLAGQEDGSFADVTRQAFDGIPLDSCSAAWGDADGDGWIDLYVASEQGSARLFENLHDGTFAERTRESGLAGIVGDHRARWFDYDGDGRADLVLTAVSGETLLHNQGDWRFERVALPFVAQPSAPAAIARPVAVAATPTLERAIEGASPRDSGDTRLDSVARVGSSSLPSRSSSTSSPGPLPSGAVSLPPGPSVGVPTGYMVLCESPTPPAGFTATGWQRDVSTGTPLWTPKAPMSAPRYSMDAASLNGRIYVVGGYDTGVLARVEEYDPATDTWTTKAAMPTARNLLAVAAAGGKVYAIAGHDGTSYLTTVEEYDPVADTWASRASKPTASTGQVAVTVNGKIYAIGGHDGSNYLATVEAYDPVADAWTSKAPMPTARFKPAAAALNGKIYVMGGSITGSVLGVVEVYDPLANAWTVRAPMPTARYDLLAVAVGEKIYAVAGYNFAPMTTVEEYSPLSNSWSARMPLSTARENLAGAAVGAQIYAIGGYGGSVLSTVESFDAEIHTLYVHRRN